MKGIAGLLLVPALAWAQTPEPEIDPATDLKISPGWLHARAHCGGCHSHALVTAQRGDRDTWLAMIRWMQDTQNLWKLAPEVENELLDYLAKNYAPRAPTRRAQLPKSLRP